MSRAHAVRKSGINLQSRSLHQFGGMKCCGADRHDLIVISVKNERGYVDLLLVFGEIGLGERPNTIKRRLEPCLHPLQPEPINHALRNAGTRTVSAVEG